MNLELLDPFGRQVPDRVDATIQLPDILHYPPVSSSSTPQPLLHPTDTTTTTTTTSKGSKLSKKKQKYDEDEEEDEEEEEEEEEEMDEDDDDELDDDDDDIEERTPKTARRRSNSKQVTAQPALVNSKSRRRTSSEKFNDSSNSFINSYVNMNTVTSNSDKKKNNINNIDNDDWKAAYHVSYNRRGTYLAVGYGSGTVAVFCTRTRTLTALYYADHSVDNNSGNYAASSSNQRSDNNPELKSTRITSNKNRSTKSSTVVNQSNSSKNMTTAGCSSLSWARRSRRLLIGNYNDEHIKIMDTTHPMGSEDCAVAAATVVSFGQTAAAAAAAATSTNQSTSHDPDDVDNDSTMGDVKEIRIKASKDMTPSTSRPSLSTISSTLPNEIIPPVYPYWKTMSTPYADNADEQKYSFVRKPLSLGTQIVQPGGGRGGNISGATERDDNDPLDTIVSTNDTTTPERSMRYPCVSFEFEHPVVGSLHIHPRYPNSGIAVLSDGSLVLFCTPFHASAPFVNGGHNYIHHNFDISGHENVKDDIDDDVHGDSMKHSIVTIYHIYNKDHVSCASFDSLGNRIYAVTKSGTILGFDVKQFWKVLVRENKSYHDGITPDSMLPLEPAIVIPRNFGTKGGGDTASSSLIVVWHLIISRNGKFLIVNSSDGTIRLYNTMECWNSVTSTTVTKYDPDCVENAKPIIKPTWIFQDVVTKVKFASCDLSGDGEFVVGGANGADNKYELHIWNTSNGALMDKLTGASTKLYSVAWHPTRSFLAVACSDGLVDIWGPRINWTAFAPDFQALPMNVEYIEREDEFDVDENGRHLAEGYYAPNDMSESMDLSTTTTPINVTKIERVPVFASDSEEEEDVFEFDVRVKNLFAGRVVETKSSNKKGAIDD